MIHKLISLVSNVLPAQTAHAHCDLPCGIYDPHQAQLAAHTVIRMTSIINEMHASSENAPFEEKKKIIHDLSRATRIKDEHAEIVKHEVRVIWADYFKPEHLEQHGNLHELVFSIMKLASKARQEVNMDAANELLMKVQDFSELFWKTKSRETVRVASGYPTGGEVVLPK
jgi:nickel superoxide dismutase